MDFEKMAAEANKEQEKIEKRMRQMPMSGDKVKEEEEKKESKIRYERVGARERFFASAQSSAMNEAEASEMFESFKIDKPVNEERKYPHISFTLRGHKIEIEVIQDPISESGTQYIWTVEGGPVDKGNTGSLSAMYRMPIQNAIRATEEGDKLDPQRRAVFDLLKRR